MQEQPPSRSTSVRWWSPPSPRLTPQPKPTTNRSPAARTSPGARPPGAPKTAEPRRKSPFDHGRGRRVLSSCQHPATSSSKHVMQRAGVTTSLRLPRVWPYATNRYDLAHGARTESIAPGRRSDQSRPSLSPAENSRARPRSTGASRFGAPWSILPFAAAQTSLLLCAPNRARSHRTCRFPAPRPPTRGATRPSRTSRKRTPSRVRVQAPTGASVAACARARCPVLRFT